MRARDGPERGSGVVRDHATAFFRRRGDGGFETVEHRQTGRGGVREERLSAVESYREDGERFRFGRGDFEWGDRARTGERRRVGRGLLPGIGDEFQEYVFNGKSEETSGVDIGGVERCRGWYFRTLGRVYAGYGGEHGAGMGWVY